MNNIQLYRGGQFYWWRKPKYTGKPTDMPHVTDKRYHIMLCRVQLTWASFELATLVMIGSDCIGSYKSNYHTITTTTTPNCGYNNMHQYITKKYNKIHNNNKTDQPSLILNVYWNYSNYINGQNTHTHTHTQTGLTTNDTL